MKSLKLAAIPACCILLVTASLAQETTGDTSSGPFSKFRIFARGAGFSVGGHNAPGLSLDNPVSGGAPIVSDGRLRGGTASFGFAAHTGSFGDRPVFFEWSSAISLANSEQRFLNPLTNSNALYLTGSTMANGSINLTTSGNAGGASASGSVSTNGASITSSASSPSGSGAAVSQFAASANATGDGAAFIALTTDGDAGEAAAVGAVFDTGGFTLVGAGDLSGTQVTSFSDDSLFHMSHDFLLTTMFPLGENWTLSPKFGPNYTYIKRRTTRSTTFDFGSTIASQQIPDIRFSNHDRLKTQYLGIVAGVGLSGKVNDDWGMSLNLEGGPARYWGHHDARSVAELQQLAIVPTTPTATDYDGSAQFGRASLTFTRSIRPGTSLSLGVFANYLSDMPTVRSVPTGASGASFSGGGASGSFTGTGGSAYTNSIVTDDMTSFGATVSMVMSF